MKNMKKKKFLFSLDGFRHAVQALWAFVTNSWLIGFFQGRIYQGKLKSICLPGLNCYSCPGALGSCPIGSLQAVLGSRNFRFSFYVAGFLIFIGALTGRFVCGWLCPFGLIQELLHKIPFKWKIRSFKGDKALRYVKYGVLLIFVVLLPSVIRDVIGQGTPWFCKLLCPAGTLEGGIPLLVSNVTLRTAVGPLFWWKFVLLLVTGIACLIIYRPFCKYICPLGAIYALFNPISVLRYKPDLHQCTHCGACRAVCGMNLDPVSQANHPECIHCGRCKKVCPRKAIR